MPRGSAVVSRRTETGTNSVPKNLLVWLFSLHFAPKLSQKEGLAMSIPYYFIADMLHTSGRMTSLVV